MVERLRPQLYAYAFFDELGPLYAIYPLWMATNGLSIGQISGIYVLWAAVGMVFEVPSGALADRVDRRRLIGLAVLLRAIGIAIWFAWPTLLGFALGTALYATHTSLASGAFEALVYDELGALDAQDAYAQVMARVGQANHVGIALGTGAAAVLLALGGSMPLLGWLTVAIHLPSLGFILTLPESAPLERDHPTLGEWFATLKQGTELAIRDVPIRRFVLLGGVLEGMFILDEYTHLLASFRGASDAWVAVVVGVVWVGLIVGGEVAARRPDLPAGVLGAVLGLAAIGTASGLVTNTVVGVATIGLAYAAMNLTWVLSDARFQARIPSEVRATVTSVRAFGSLWVSMAALAGIGWMAIGNDPQPGLLIALAVLTIAGGFVARWVGPQIGASIAEESRMSA